MTIYLLDVGKEKPALSERDTLVAEAIILNRDLIRGFTMNRMVMIQYQEFMTEIIGKYVDILVCSQEVSDNIPDEHYESLALKIHNELFKGESFYASTCPEIHSYRLDSDRGYVIATESMIEYSTSTWDYEYILEDILILFDDTFRKYVPGLYTNDKITHLKQFILDGILERVEDFFDVTTGKYYFDMYGILRSYMLQRKFL